MERFNSNEDKYQNVFQEYCEYVFDNIDIELLQSHSFWFEEYDGDCSQWLNELWSYDIDKDTSVKILSTICKKYIK